MRTGGNYVLHDCPVRDSHEPWVSWEACAVLKWPRQKSPAARWSDLPFGTLAASTALAWQRQGRVELRERVVNGQTLLEAKPIIRRRRP